MSFRKENNVEWEFFKYAFPCSQVLLQQGKITKEEYEDLKKKFLDCGAPEREILERVFSAAFVRIKKLASEQNKDYWDFEVINEYWENYHNKIIDEGEGIYGKAPESFKDLCKIHEAEVVERKGNMLIVRYSGDGSRDEDRSRDETERVIFDTLVKDAKVGDKVKIHYGYGVEMVGLE